MVGAQSKAINRGVCAEIQKPSFDSKSVYKVNFLHQAGEQLSTKLCRG